jgi:acetolactate synthase regulatory subunit
VQATGDTGQRGGPDPVVQVELHVHGKESVTDLAAALSELKDVNAVLATDAHAVDE